MKCKLDDANYLAQWPAIAPHLFQDKNQHHHITVLTKVFHGQTLSPWHYLLLRPAPHSFLCSHQLSCCLLCLEIYIVHSPPPAGLLSVTLTLTVLFETTPPSASTCPLPYPVPPYLFFFSIVFSIFYFTCLNHLHFLVCLLLPEKKFQKGKICGCFVHW